MAKHLGNNLDLRSIGLSPNASPNRGLMRLQLRIEVEGEVIGFYREDTGEKLLIPDELAIALRESTQQFNREAISRQQAEQRVQELESILALYRDRFGELPTE